jgi:ribosomal protein L11 methylase PrmA
MENLPLPSSFRDPSGFVFKKDGAVYRQINISYKDNYDRLMNSGLYASLVSKRLLVPHEEINPTPAERAEIYKIIKPKQIPFISYPYEWCFGQIKEAALTTLNIQKEALAFGMSLKDCSAYNMQFLKGKAIFIDTLSFEVYKEGQPWVAYRQFCQHFLAPIALMCHKDVRLNKLSSIYIDGIPLDLASSLLPIRVKFKLSLFAHLWLHSKSQKHFAAKSIENKSLYMNRKALLVLVDSLESAIKRLHWEPGRTEWGDYYEKYGVLKEKQTIISDFLDRIKPVNVWDMGGNTGVYGSIAARKGIPTVMFDNDPKAIEKAFAGKEEGLDYLPLILDLTNPSPGIGWENKERMSLVERGKVDTVLFLALIHHLAISNNVPFRDIARFLSGICRSLIIEFVPKLDPRVRDLLASREDIFVHYTEEEFENMLKQ